MAQFQADLARYSKFELIVAEWLNGANDCLYQQAHPDSYFPDYDLICHGVKHFHRLCPTIECKFDTMSRKYNSFLFEVKLLKNSKADDLYFGDGVELFIFNRIELTRKLRELYQDKKAWLIKVGDGGRSECIKVMRNAILSKVSYKRFPFEIDI